MQAIKIPLSQNKFATIDAEDFQRVNQFKWYCTKLGYAAHGIYEKGSGRRNRKSSIMLLHRFILNTPEGKIIDHANRNPLDNRKSNLRICNQSQNLANSKLATTNKSGYKGVCWHALGKGYWRASITVHQKHKFIGLYNTRTEAALAYNRAAEKYFGEYARGNTL